eukprot:1158026-Pelagomonas_calceolata.AAC.3
MHTWTAAFGLWHELRHASSGTCMQLPHACMRAPLPERPSHMAAWTEARKLMVLHATASTKALVFAFGLQHVDHGWTEALAHVDCGWTEALGCELQVLLHLIMQPTLAFLAPGTCYNSLIC